MSLFPAGVYTSVCTSNGPKPLEWLKDMKVTAIVDLYARMSKKWRVKIGSVFCSMERQVDKWGIRAGEEEDGQKNPSLCGRRERRRSYSVGHHFFTGDFTSRS